MEILELFCGTKSFSKAASARGHKTTTVDINPRFAPDMCIDILDASVYDFPKCDVLWASPPCTAFSVASIGTHWRDGQPITGQAMYGIWIVEKTLEIIDHLKPKMFFIENPRGMMRKLELLEGIPRTSVSYCQYGDTRMKPTDIWTDSGWIGRICKNGDPCHVRAPRGSRTGTQGITGAIDRGAIPPKLCDEILAYCERGWMKDGRYVKYYTM